MAEMGVRCPSLRISFALVTQRYECFLHTEEVVGSIPTEGTKLRRVEELVDSLEASIGITKYARLCERVL